VSAAGKFREQITLITPTKLVQNSSGGFSPALTGSALGSGTLPFVLGTPTIGTNVTTWGKVEQLAAKEELVNGKLKYKQPYRITIRFTNAVVNVDRITWKGITIAINSVTQDARKTEKILFGYATN
jgi:hypothetical protein